MFTHLHALHCFLPFSKCQKPAKTICLIFKFLFTPDLACSRAEIVYFVMSCHWLLSTICCSHWLLNENLFIPWWLTQEESNCVTRNSIWVNLDFYTSWDLKDRYFLLVKETFSSDLTCSWIAVSSESVKDVSKKFQIQVSHSSKEPQKVLKKIHICKNQTVLLYVLLGICGARGAPLPWLCLAQLALILLSFYLCYKKCYVTHGSCIMLLYLFHKNNLMLMDITFLLFVLVNWMELNYHAIMC